MISSTAFQRHMKGWLISDDGDRWSVKLDVRDLGSHRQGLALHSCCSLKSFVSAIPWTLAVAASRGIEAALSQSSHLRLRAAFVSLLVWQEYGSFRHDSWYAMAPRVFLGAPGHGLVHLLVRSAAERWVHLVF